MEALRRGFGTIELMIAAVVLGAFIGLGLWIFNAGKASKQAEWTADNLKKSEEARRKDLAVGASLLLADQKARAAEARAAENETKLKEKRREASRNGKPLGECVAEGRPAEPVRSAGALASAEAQGSGLRAPASASGAPAAGGVCRVHWLFVGLHDAAFTGLDGKPIFEAASGFALDSSRADAASPYRLEDVLDVDNENAMKFSACRRAVAEIRSKVEAAAAAWDADR